MKSTGDDDIQPTDADDQDTMRQNFAELPFDVLSPTPFTQSQLAWPLLPQSIISDAPMSMLGFDPSYTSYASPSFKAPTPLPSFSFEEDYGEDLGYEIPTAGISPGSISESGLSASSYNDEALRRFSAVSTSTPRITTKGDLEQDPRLRDSIQTVSEARKSRRRAQNRSAQQAFKERRKTREKELTKQINQAEEDYKKLEEENEELKRQLDRRKKDRSASEESGDERKSTQAGPCQKKGKQITSRGKR